MTPCTYKERAGCTFCDQVIYKNCPKFQKAHIQELSSELLPFKFKELEVKELVAYSNDADTAKSAAVIKANKLNIKVKRITINQAMEIAMGNEELERYIYYVDCSNKMAGLAEKVNGVLVSFIDKCAYKGFPVYLYKPATIVILPISNYTRL